MQLPADYYNVLLLIAGFIAVLWGIRLFVEFVQLLELSVGLSQAQVRAAVLNRPTMTNADDSLFDVGCKDGLDATVNAFI